ncbi:MAG: hypothetical protein WC139_10215 [Candidatus Kapaibacterium sp.]
MNKIIITVIITVLFAAAVETSAQDSYGNYENIDKNNSMQIIKEKILDKESDAVSTKSIPLNVDSSKLKSPILGASMSAIIPGTGQIYAKSFIKSAIFIAVEAGLWITYAVFQGKGNDQTTTYENYAKQNWNMRKYAEWLKKENFQRADQINMSSDDYTLRLQINYCEEINFSHQLPPPGDQQYYEVIGKYQNYVTGWSTADVTVINKNNYGTTKLSQVSFYMDERQKANDYYNNGTTTLMVVVLNHLVSAVDGFLSVNSYNNKYVLKGSVSFQPVYSSKLGKSVVTPFANISFTF